MTRPSFRRSLLVTFAAYGAAATTIVPALKWVHDRYVFGRIGSWTTLYVWHRHPRPGYLAQLVEPAFGLPAGQSVLVLRVENHPFRDDAVSWAWVQHVNGRSWIACQYLDPCEGRLVARFGIPKPYAPRPPSITAVAVLEKEDD